MGFVEFFLKKEGGEISPEDIEAFISQRIEESINLDYKHIDAYHDSLELAKDVSAFANSAGGLIILGVEEDRSDLPRIYPKQITWGDKSLSKETLENRLLSKISYRVEGVRIMPIRKSDKSVIFLVDIPQSENPPHMLSEKHQYFKRFNFQSVPMEHYEIGDIFGRRRRPRLSLVIEVLEAGDWTARNVQCKLRLHLTNKGKKAAKYTMLTISFGGATAIGEERSANVIRIDNLRNGVPTLQYNDNISIIHANPTRRLKIIDVNVGFENPVNGEYSIEAEDMNLVTGTFIIRREFVRFWNPVISSGRPVNIVVQEEETKFYEY